MPSPLSTDFAAAPWRQKLRDGLGDLAPERRNLAPAAAAQLQPPAAGAALLDLASNDYLGLSRHPAVLAAAAAELVASGLGAGGSRLVTGTRPVHLPLEAEHLHSGTDGALAELTN
jgi:8-amino-7-oxononanoate synthase